MKILVTAGNTQAPIDRVRCLTNIFTGRTGAQIALEARGRGHHVQLLTSHPEAVEKCCATASLAAPGWALLPYTTFADLQQLLEDRLTREPLDVIIHCAAVSDFLSAGIFAPVPGTMFDTAALAWRSPGPEPVLMDMAADKVKSDAPELWLRLVRAPKLIDRMRSDWGFRGLLVKFKLEVGVTEEALLEIAERSRRQSDADLMVANTLEGAKEWALLGPIAGGYERIARPELAVRLLDTVEALHRAKTNG
jgi:phosphopantothenoylcysteine synthetase/decarboxylase